MAIHINTKYTFIKNLNSAFEFISLTHIHVNAIRMYIDRNHNTFCSNKMLESVLWFYNICLWDLCSSLYWVVGYISKKEQSTHISWSSLSKIEIYRSSYGPENICTKTKLALVYLYDYLKTSLVNMKTETNLRETFWFYNRCVWPIVW